MIWRFSAMALSLLLAAAGLWSVGFTAFDHDARMGAPLPTKADGIVVLTGGADRIETALRLLADGVAPRLLISGAGRGSELAEFARRVPLDPAMIADRVTLGHIAATTNGNAAETEAWARRNNVRKLIVVTAGYHMPRALIEIERQLPDVELAPYPVQPKALRGHVDVATVRLLAAEYDKLLAVRFGLNALAGKGK